jgi:beta-glucosidase
MAFNMPIMALDDSELITIKPVPRIEWWNPRHEEKKKQAREQDFNLVMIGDSITHHWQDFMNRPNSGQKTWDQYYAKRKTLNLGFSGDQTQHVLWRLQNGEIDGISPKLTVLMIGINNIRTGHSGADVAVGIQHIIKEIRTRLPDSKILLLATFPSGEKANNKHRAGVKELNDITSDYADNEHVYFLDINNIFLDDEGTLYENLMPDFLHPNSKGYQLWAEAMEPTIKMLMGE